MKQLADTCMDSGYPRRTVQNSSPGAESRRLGSGVATCAKRPATQAQTNLLMDAIRDLRPAKVKPPQAFLRCSAGTCPCPAMFGVQSSWVRGWLSASGEHLRPAP